MLRGSGQDEKGTILAATGVSRRTLIEIGGRGEPTEVPGSRRSVADAFVPAGATKLALENTRGLVVGDAGIHGGDLALPGFADRPLSFADADGLIVRAQRRVVIAVAGVEYQRVLRDRSPNSAAFADLQ